MSTSAAHHLSPAFPERAAWGTAPKLRAWQEGALAAYLERSAAGEKDFLTVATPGAGKTTYALQVATELLDRGLIREVTVVAPTEHLKHQWADAAARVGIHLNPAFANSVAVQSHEYGGVALTYAQVASRPDLHRQRTLARPTLVILDEIHHGGDAKSWGDAIREAFEPATRRLSLTGTPFRSDTSPIPFVRYEMDEQGILRSAADHSYGYAEALRDGVVRPVLFLAYGGAMRWRTKAGDEVAARLGEPMTKDAAAQAWRTALDPKGEWIPSVLRAADKRLTEVRRHVPDAGAMVIASNQTAARAYARHLETITGEKPTVVLSDDSGASTRIEEYAAGTSRWLVAVRMVSEGVDVPRLCVGVYATSTSTPLFFAQAVGRFVRARKRGETASVFLPSVPIILELAATMEAQRDHALDRPSSDESEASLWAEEEGLIAAANRTERTLGIDEPSFEALESEAHFDHVLFDKQQFGLHAAVGSQEEQDYLGLPGLLEPDQVATLLNERQAKQSRQTKGSTRPTNPAPVSAHRALAAQRKELNSLVAAYAKKTGAPHANVHMELRRACGGPELAQASSEQVTERIDRIRRWFVGRR
ncbi:MAG TPA: DEAD/DEAH box helicase [Phycicoccus elongatus]|jgi:superfamily II DNA or RNA helicase|uniref:DEAD/DEAH box helicase n=2 Tax=Intrasporangiaceae TaxID=85021 RepID=UPI00258910C6|nr:MULTISPECIES: DEAD/DEAH box helicase [Phycicoccus]MCB9407246.1 DEAD/DEAH box helicase [Tetrasphaera sp.]MCO5302184.1 DEAD/DEAH box helicase [Phycicoccus sp.]HOA66763.1 DEAD/DEAH box helicase [Phycicoccus elongatus]HPF77348.1 DEAD/DEAH box helicase [Phycicoccus elongatus]HPK11310.1 DEAD/DEAH box helicase [Phycicoccus elongatus]